MAFNQCILIYLKVSALVLHVFLFVLTGSSIAGTVAVLQNVHGKVGLFKEGQKRGQKAIMGTRLEPGDRIMTNSDSFADLVYKNKSLVRIMPKSLLMLTVARFSGRRSLIKIKLKAGKIFALVPKLDRDSKYVVETPTGKIAVKGTFFSAKARPGKSVFMVRKGTLVATNPNASKRKVLVQGLKKTVITENTEPTTPISLSPDEIALFDTLEEILQNAFQEALDETEEAVKEDLLEIP